MAIGFNISELGACYTDPSLLVPTAVICCFILLPCLLGNALILISILKFPFLRTKTHIVIGNLAVSDLLVGVSLIIEPLEISLRDVTSRYKYVCLLKYCFFMVSVTSSVANLLILSVERFLAVLFPFQHRRYLTTSRLYLVIVFMWLVHIVLGLLPLLGWNNYSLAGAESLSFCISDVIWPAEYVLILMVDLTVGLGLTTFIYIAVVYVAVRKARQRPDVSREVSACYTTKPAGIKRKTKMVICVFGAFFLCWLPFEVVSFLIRLHDTVEYRCLQHRLIILGFANSAINWAIYGCTNNRFRLAFQKLLQCCCCCRDTDSSLQVRSRIRFNSSVHLSIISSSTSAPEVIVNRSSISQ